MRHEASASVPDISFIGVQGREDIEKVLNVHILRLDPPRFTETWPLGINIDRQAGEVKIFGRAEERG